MRSTQCVADLAPLDVHYKWCVRLKLDRVKIAEGIANIQLSFGAWRRHFRRASGGESGSGHERPIVSYGRARVVGLRRDVFEIHTLRRRRWRSAVRRGE